LPTRPQANHHPTRTRSRKQAHRPGTGSNKLLAALRVLNSYHIDLDKTRLAAARETPIPGSPPPGTGGARPPAPARGPTDPKTG